MNPNFFSSLLIIFLAIGFAGLSLMRFTEQREPRFIAYLIAAGFILIGYVRAAWQFYLSLPILSAPLIRFGLGLLLFALILHHAIMHAQFLKAGITAREF